MSDRTVVITGAGGFVGARLRRGLETTGDRVLAWTRSDVDMLDPQAVHDGIATADPEVVIHLAATGVTHDRAHDPEIVAENLRMTVNLCYACNPGVTLVIAGSMAEYGNAGTLNETHRCDPTTAYGIAKLAATNYALSYGVRKGLSVRVARLFGIYGPGEPKHRLFPALLDNLRRGVAVPLSDGLQRRDFVHVDDVCEGLMRIMDAEVPDGGLLVNLGTGAASRVRDVARWMAASLNADETLLQFGARDRSPGDADLIVADMHRLRQAIGWVPPQRLGPAMDLKALFG